MIHREWRACGELEDRCPVSDHEQIGEVIADAVIVGDKPAGEKSHQKGEEIERPDAQDPTHIEERKTDRSGSLPLPQQEGADEIAAGEKEEFEGNAARKEDADSSLIQQRTPGNVGLQRYVKRMGMAQEDHEKAETAQRVQLRPVEADLRWGLLRRFGWTRVRVSLYDQRNTLYILEIDR